MKQAPESSDSDAPPADAVVTPLPPETGNASPRTEEGHGLTATGFVLLGLSAAALAASRRKA